jgi:F-type H+-transporting ATPase subunit g
MSFALGMRRSGLSMGRRMVRFESTNTTTQKAAETAKQAASKASSTASETVSKASQGLSRVASSAGPVIVGAAKGAATTLSKMGGRTGRLVAFVERKETSRHPNTVHPTVPFPCALLGGGFCCALSR